MPSPAAKPFTFICGQDDFLVGRMGKARFAELLDGSTDEFAREVISGFAANVDEVAAAIARLAEAIQTIPMFGGRRVVWFKDVNFLADSPTGNAESTLERVEGLQALLETVDPAETAVLVTAAPVDRRRRFPKWCEKHADFALADAGEGAEGLAGVVLEEARAVGAQFGPGALDLLLAKIGPNTRLLTEEVRKLATYAEDGTIAEADVAALSPDFAKGDFFESAEAFFSGDLTWTLAALHRHFFAGGDARPILTALQNRNRLLLQVRALADAGAVKVGPRGLDGLARAAGTYAGHFGAAAGEKSGFNVFSQNAWYVGKLVGSARLPPLRRLIDTQRELVAAFAAIIDRPHEQEEVLRDLAVRCLAA